MTNRKRFISISILLIALFCTVLYLAYDGFFKTDLQNKQKDDEAQVTSIKATESAAIEKINDFELLRQETENLEPFASKEILGVEDFHDDWSIEQFEQSGYVKTENKGTGEISLQKEAVVYNFSFMNEYALPVSIHINGPTTFEVLRNIQVGDSFKSVIRKFPNHFDWRKQVNGEFYGISNESDEPSTANGHLSEYDNSDKSMTLVSELEGAGVFVQLAFEKDILVQLRIYLPAYISD